MFSMKYNDFTIQESMIFHNVHDLFRYQFGYWLVTIFGIDFDSILVPLSHQILSFGVIVLVGDSLDGIFIDDDQK